MEMFRKTFAEINLDHLEHNLNVIRTAFPNDYLCPMVKANAYGHGDLQIAFCLEKLGVQNLGVCLIEEGLLLRNFGVRANILVFRGFDRAGAKKILQYNLTPVVSSWAHLQHLEAVAQELVSVHIKFDTGMNRLGFSIDDAQKLFDYFWQNKRIRAEAILTHLSEGEDGYLESGNTVDQLTEFSTVIQTFKALDVKVHVLNSAGIISAMKVRHDKKNEHPLAASTWGLRPGLMLYGYNPLQSQFPLSLKPVMTLKSVAGVFRQLQKDEAVSYNSTWRAARESMIAVVPIGYADGYHRMLSNKAEALFMNQRVPVVGNICMDFLMLDVTEVAKIQDFDVQQEHEVILFGSSADGTLLSAQELAKKSQTIPWEILTSVGERVPRQYTGALASLIRDQESR
jgi:alanine racemase